MPRSISRRHAIQWGAFGAIAPFLLPSGLRADPNAPSNRVTLGCIGVGGMGGSNMRSFLGLDDCRVVAVCDPHKGKAQRAKNEVDRHYGDTGCAAYADFRELIARPDIDAVMVATPDHWHAVIAVAAAKAGKDIYGEKPLAHSYREGRAVADAVRRYGRVWQTGSWQRSIHNFPRGCELVFNGRIGKVHTIEVGLPVDAKSGQDVKYDRPAVPEGLDYDLWVGPASWMPYHPELTDFNWRWNLNFGGGGLLDWVGHHLDIGHWAMDWDTTGPVAIEGTGQYQKKGLYDAAYRFRATLEYPGDVKVILAGNDGIPNGTKWIGDQGWIRVDRGVLQASKPEILNEKLAANERAFPRSRGHQREFIDCIRSRRATLTPAETAHRSAGPGHLAQIAMQLGRRLRFDPVKEQILNDETAHAMLGRALRAPWSV